jgi:hypothetical protein
VKPPDPPKRAFTRLVGRESPEDSAESAEAVAADAGVSPLAEIIPFPEPQQPHPESAPNRGRPRKHKDNAAKQKAHRERRDSGAIAGERVAKKPKVSTDNTLMVPIHEKWFIPGAAHGKGLMITGEYNSRKIKQVTAAHDRDENGRRVRPEGYGVDSDSDEIISDWTLSRKIWFPKIDKLDDAEKWRILVDLVRENTEEEPCQDLENVAKQYWKDYHTVRCLLCNQTLGTALWILAGDGFTIPHFMSKHLRLVQKTLKACAPKPAPKPCSEDHVGTAKRLGEVNTVGRVYCKRCRKLIFDSTDPRSPYFRNKSSEGTKSSEVNHLSEKMKLSPIRGETTSPSASQQEPQGIANTQDIQNKEVA